MNWWADGILIDIRVRLINLRAPRRSLRIAFSSFYFFILLFVAVVKRTADVLIRLRGSHKLKLICFDRGPGSPMYSCLDRDPRRYLSGERVRFPPLHIWFYMASIMVSRRHALTTPVNNVNCWLRFIPTKRNR